MSPVIAVIGVLLLAAWACESWGRRGARRRRREDRERERDKLSHITGARPWWKEPPGDGPEGDH